MQLETPGQTNAPVSPPTNPVYSEITDVSALDPVYTEIDKREPRTQAYVNVIGQGNTVAYEVQDPLGQCVTSSADSVDGINDKDGVDLTKNEAYGLIRW